MPDPRVRVATLASELLGTVVDPAALRLDEAAVGDGYECPTATSTRAMDLAAVQEGVVLDPVYGAKAMAALMTAVDSRDLPRGEQTVLVLSGGLPGFFGHPAAAELAGRTAPPV